MADWKPTLTPTGIGTLPLAEVEKGLDLVLEHLPEMPFWPQLTARGPWEDMMIQFAPGLPCLKVDPERRMAMVDPTLDRTEALTRFYEAVLDSDRRALSLSPDHAPGFFALRDRLAVDPGRLVRPKGHVTGPITFCLAVKDETVRDVIHDPELLAALALGLGHKGAWQVENLPAAPNPALIFIDEPALTGFGSAFMALDHDTARLALNTCAEPIHDAGGLAGIHVCGNTDWSLPLSADLDVVNFDAYGFGREFTLYPREITAFLERGGVLAWGIVPTLAYTGSQTVDELTCLLESLVDDLAASGLNRNRIREQSILTPACGLGSLSSDNARAILALLAETANRLRN